jgi:hypothetical protein
LLRIQIQWCANLPTAIITYIAVGAVVRNGRDGWVKTRTPRHSHKMLQLNPPSLWHNVGGSEAAHLFGGPSGAPVTARGRQEWEYLGSVIPASDFLATALWHTFPERVRPE